jgi:hypothetical protein
MTQDRYLMNLPPQTTPARIEPLATLPVFFKLKGKKVVLVGSSEGAAWKAELLLAAGADLHVFVGDAGDEVFETLLGRYAPEPAPVMRGLDPAYPRLSNDGRKKDVDGRIKSGHDGWRYG